MDLIQHVEGILKNWSQNLESHVRKEDRHNFICEVDSIMNQYFNALSSIVPIFTYLVIGFSTAMDIYELRQLCFIDQTFWKNLL